jgi:SPP1 gp7 family putative phage head morphogenesis protein
MVAASKNRTLSPIRPSAALDVEYQKRLDRLIAEMQKSLVWWIEAAYKAKPPEMAGDASVRDAKQAVSRKYDGSPSMVMQRVMRRLSQKWQRRFDEAAPKMAEYFSTEIARRNDRALSVGLRKSGLSVKFKMTAQMNDVMRASMNEQVSLIKSIAQQHLQEVEGLVMRSVAQGGNLAELSQQLEHRYGVTKRRAAFIATDQNSKATATLQRVRQTELGIEEAEWRHSHAGKTPRPSHVAMNGTAYKIKDGMPDPALGGKRIWPGTEPRCRCFSKPILPKALLQASA